MVCIKLCTNDNYACLADWDNFYYGISLIREHDLKLIFHFPSAKNFHSIFADANMQSVCCPSNTDEIKSLHPWNKVHLYLYYVLFFGTPLLRTPFAQFSCWAGEMYHYDTTQWLYLLILPLKPWSGEIYCLICLLSMVRCANALLHNDYALLPLQLKSWSGKTC
jgi:hypothetical protein